MINKVNHGQYAFRHNNNNHIQHKDINIYSCKGDLHGGGNSLSFAGSGGDGGPNDALLFPLVHRNLLLPAL